MTRLRLPEVTLCAAASVNVTATIAALNRCCDHIEFGACLLFTDLDLRRMDVGKHIDVVSIERLWSAEAYSHFLLRDLAGYLETTHCLVVQWDGFVIDSACWDPQFLSFDYIGAPWPQFGDEHVVGNGGFSLRSRKLLDSCKDPEFLASHPEDVAIARTNRRMLEHKHGIRFASRDLAESFSFERTLRKGPTFGFHGIFNLVDTLGPDEFWETYLSLDDRSTVATDYWRLMQQLGQGRGAWARRARLTLDRLKPK